MNIWRGTDLAADILDSVKDAPGDRVAQVIVKSTDEPYYKGICADAKKCGVEIITAEKIGSQLRLSDHIAKSRY